MTNQDISTTLSAIARMLTLLEENPFKIRAYERVAQTLENFPEEIAAVYARGGLKTLREIPGIGEDLSLKLEEMITTGKLLYRDELQKKVPAGLFEVMEIPGLGPKKTAFLWKTFGVESVEDVEMLLAKNALDDLKGWGEKSIENLKRGIQVKKSYVGRFRRDIALAEAERIVDVLRNVKGCERAEYAGSLRRGKETVGDIDILACGEDSEALVEAFLNVDGIADRMAKGETRAAIRLQSGLQADLRVVDASAFGAAWHYFTGSKEHNVRLRQLGIERGLTISEYGVYEGTAEKKGILRASKTEEDIYAVVGLPWIPPTLREDRGEFDAAKAGTLPILVEERDLHGDLHMHTTFSDGAATMIEMARAAKDAGLSYIAITDHASPMGMVRGLKEGNIDEYLSLIEEARKAVPGITIFAGAEVDILPDGSLYLPDSILKQLDWVNAAIHAHFTLDQAAQTKRYIRAIQNKHVRCIAHPMTRMVAERDGIEPDWDAVFDAAHEAGTAIEMNASVQRLDLSDVLARRAKEKGVMLTIGSDAHSVEGLSKAHGIIQAQRAWLTKEDFVTTKSVADFSKWLLKVKK